MKESILFKSLLTTIVIAALSAPASAVADDKNELKGASVKVTYADLNVANETGAKSLYRRLKNASKEVCDYRRLSNAGSVRRIAKVEQCYKEALSTAVKLVDNELVTDIHEG